MLTLHVEGKNYAELTHNALTALGAKVGPNTNAKQMEFQFAGKNEAKGESPQVTASSAETPVNAAPQTVETKPAATRTRRTKAQIEADKAAEAEAQAAAPAEAVEEVEENTPEEKAVTSIAEIKAEAAKADELSVKSCQEILKRVIATKGMDIAIAVIAKFGVKKVPELKPEQFAAFTDAANAALK